MKSDCGHVRGNRAAARLECHGIALGRGACDAVLDWYPGHRLSGSLGGAQAAPDIRRHRCMMAASEGMQNGIIGGPKCQNRKS